MENNSWKMMRKSTFSPRISPSPNLQKKKNIRKEFFPFVKDSDRNNNKKVIDFPLHLTLFIKTKENSVDNAEKKHKNKFNIKLSSFKPKDLNLKSLNLNNINKLNEKNIISRNLNLSGNASSNNILNVDSFNSSKILNINKLLNSIKSPRIRLKSINFTPLNINTKNSPIIINQIGLDNSSTTKLSSKLNNLSNNSIENDSSFINNMKHSSNKNLSRYNISFNDKKIPSIFQPISSNTKRKSFFKNTNIKKPNLKDIKKLLQKDVNNYETDKINNINNNVNNIINEENDNNNNENMNDTDINNNNIKSTINSINYLIRRSIDNSNNKNKFKFNFKLFKDKTYERHNSINIMNFRNSLATNNKKEKESEKENEDINSQEKKDILDNDDFKKGNKFKRNTSVVINDRKKLSFDVSKIKENKNVIKEEQEEKEQKEEEKEDNKSDNHNEITFLTRKKTGKKSHKIHPNKSRKFTSHKRKEVKMLTHKFYSLKLEKPKQNKFLNKFKDTKYIYEKQNISLEKSKILLNMQIKTKNYTNNNKRKNIIIELTQELKIHEFNKIKETYFREITNPDNNKNVINNEISHASIANTINKNFNISTLLSQYILISYEFSGLSSSNSLIKRRNAKTFEPKDESNEYGIMIQERFLKKEEDTFKRTKSNVFLFHNFNKNNWMRTSKNIMRIHEITLKANNFDYFNDIKNINKSKFRRSSTLKERRDTNNDVVKKNFIQNISSSKMNSISPMTLRKRKSIRLSYKTKESHSNYNILEMKKFFSRNNPKINNQQELHLDLKEEKEFSSLSDNSLRVYSSNNVTNYKLEEYYYVLLNCIIKGLNKNFINVFQKMQKKIDINQQIYEGNTLLIFSSKEGNFAISKYLCSQGADVNIQNDSGNTALHYAIANQFFSIVDILKASGAKEDIVNNKGYTPWDCIEHGL